MAHGTPDFGTEKTTENVYAITDVAELAARLGSGYNILRRGNVLGIWDNESGYQECYFSGAGGATAYGHYANIGYASGHAFKLIPWDDAVASAKAEQAIGGVYSTTIGFHVKMAVEYHYGVVDFVVRVIKDGTYYQGYVRYDSYNGYWQYYHGDNGLTTFYTPSPALTNNLALWHSLDIVINWSTEYFVSLRLNNTSYDVSAVPIQSAPLNLPDQTGWYIQAATNTSNQGGFVFDDVVLTINEE